ncbi:MAG: hypothetical protein ACTSPI_14035 [Candidatus Heimdallarchaeaceae archaeon]
MALIWGFISHWVMDETCSEYRPRTLEARKWIPYLLWELGIVVVFLWYSKYWWAILGILPDIVEFGYVMVKGINVWMTGDLLFPFHRYKKFKPMWSMKFTVMMEFIFVIFILIVKKVI